MRDPIERFFGVWWLQREASDFGPLPAPRAGVLSVLREPAGLWFYERILDQTHGPQRAQLRGPLDADVAIDPQAPGVLARTTLEAGALSTEVTADGARVLEVQRTLVGPDELEIRQTMQTEAGPVHTRARFTRSAPKQVLVYRRDLKMRKGKIAAQCAHASMAVFFRRDEGPLDRVEVPLDGPMAAWAKGRFAKVVLSVETEPELLKIAELAEARGLPCALITDAGKTEFKGQPTRTTVAIGPAAAEEIDAITGPEGEVATKLA